MPVQKKLSAKSKQKAPTKRTYVTKSKKPTFLESLLTGKRKWAVVGVCLVLFGAVGTYMLRPSSADSLTKTSNCRQYSIKDSRTKYTCVKYIQEMINGTNVYKLPTGGYSYRYHPAMLKVDGYYGAKTKAGVVSFQKSTKNNGTPLAATAINRIFPSGLGGMGAHGLYLFKRGHSKTAAALVVGTNNLLGFFVHIFLLSVAVLLAPQTLQDFDLPRLHGYSLLVAVLLAMLGVWYAKRRGAYGAIQRNIHKTIGEYARQPVKLGVAAISLFGVTLTNFVIFMLACAAMGISLPLVTGFLIFSIGILVGAATPTPGGLAGVEAGLVAGLLAVNVDEVSAIAAVLAFRFVTFWLPLIPGIVALVYVRKQKLL